VVSMKVTVSADDTIVKSYSQNLFTATI
jgi:hypothetical protein